MNFLEKMGMKTAMKRLQDSGVAPSGEIPIDFDSGATPGNVNGQVILLLTDRALYLGSHNAAGGKRLDLSSIGGINIEVFGKAVHYVVFEKSNNIWADVTFPSGRKSFNAQVHRLKQNLGKD